MRRFLFPLVLLTLIYALVLASFAPADLAMGALVSGALLLAFRGFVFDERPAERPAEAGGILGRIGAFFPFAVATARSIVAGTWEVALVTLHLRPIPSPGIVEIPIANRTPTGVAVSALATTLSPGAFLVDVDRERGTFLIHVIDASDPGAVRREHEDFYRRYQSKVFP